VDVAKIARRVQQAGVYFVTSDTWHRSFHDRWIRDAEQYRNAKLYIELNPVKANLVEKPEGYAWSSANDKFVLDPSRFD
jgi:hypothetical protein